MSLSTLPDLCLLAVFDRIPLQQVNALGQVCQRWSSLLRIAFNRRRSLILIFASNKEYIEERFKVYGAFQHNNPFNESLIKSPNDENKFNARRKLALLEFSSLKEIDSNLLSNTLPNITNLEIIHQGVLYPLDNRGIQAFNDTNKLITLMSHWSGKLKTLQYSKFGLGLTHSLALFDAFNVMPALKRLWFEVYFDVPSQVDLPVLAQLDPFYICSSFPSLPYQFKKYASVMNPKLKIAIGHPIREENELANYCNFNDQLAERIVRCEIYLDFKVMQGFYAKFTSLTDVAVNMRNVTLSQLCLGLSALTNLTRLSFFPCGDSGSVRPFSEEDQLSSNNFPPFTSVHTLFLNFKVNSHLDYNSVHLSHIFPAVHWVNAKYIYGRCVLCDIDYNYGLEDNNERYQGCFQQLVKPFRMLPKLEEVLEFKWIS